MTASAISATASATLSAPESAPESAPASAPASAPDVPAIITTKPARDFRKMLEETAGFDMLLHKARPQLRDAAKKVFTSPVTVAFAAASLGIDLSVKGLDREDTDARAWVQRVRVTLQRALNDANLLKTDSGKGRKKAPPAAQGADEKAPAVDVVLSLLPNLAPSELDRIAETVAEMLTAQLQAAA
jgi:hypothetical protein